MAKPNPWKIGIGAGAVLLGIYFAFNQKDVTGVIIGFAFMAFGIGLIASS